MLVVLCVDIHTECAAAAAVIVVVVLDLPFYYNLRRVTLETLGTTTSLTVDGQ